MDGRTDRWPDGSMDGWVNGWIDGWIFFPEESLLGKMQQLGIPMWPRLWLLGHSDPQELIRMEKLNTGSQSSRLGQNREVAVVSALTLSLPCSASLPLAGRENWPSPDLRESALCTLLHRGTPPPDPCPQELLFRKQQERGSSSPLLLRPAVLGFAVLFLRPCPLALTPALSDPEM